MREEEILLGNNKNGEIIFGNVEIRNRNNGNELEFSASFDVVIPFNVDHFNERLKDDYIESYIECFDDKYKMKLLKEYDCKPSELHDVLKDTMEYNDLVDCSLYNEEYDINGKTFAFESSSCGQHDILKNEYDKIVDFTDKESVMIIYNMWQEKHLSQITLEEKEMIEKAIEKLKNINKEEYIKNVIINKFM